MRFLRFMKFRPNMAFHREARSEAAEVKAVVASIREKRESFPISGFIADIPPRHPRIQGVNTDER